MPELETMVGRFPPPLRGGHVHGQPSGKRPDPGGDPGEGEHPVPGLLPAAGDRPRPECLQQAGGRAAVLRGHPGAETTDGEGPADTACVG